MTQNNDYDYSALGLKCGLELHQQLETKRKLFCYCKPELNDKKTLATIIRFMRPTLSELGEYDKAALQEFKKRKKIIYEIPDSVCTYELDETPPFKPDPDAIDLALKIAFLLNMDVFDELQINRKQYLDGSIPSGFQRTMIIGVNGQVQLAEKTIPLEMLALEEDSCREIKSSGQSITWRVDRLSIPLVEITTKTFSLQSPEEITSVAETIGRILRATSKVKRGIGTIRQDLNISIAKGARVEIKGVQKLELLPLFIKLEVERQLALLELQEELAKRKLTPEMFQSDTWKDCLALFEQTKSEFLRKAIQKRWKIYALKLEGLAGLLGKKIQLERTFGKELADRVKVMTGLGGILHTDELPKLGISEQEVEQLKNHFNCTEKDAVVIVIGQKAAVLAAFDEIILRIKEAFIGVPQETRQALEDGTTMFRRYLGGASRLYPDTDSYPIVLSEKHLKKIKDNLPELPDVRLKRYVSELKLPHEIAYKLVISPKVELFEKLVKNGTEPMLAAITLEQTIKALAREGVETANLTDECILGIFNLLNAGKISKEAIESLLKYFAEHPKDTLEMAVTALGLKQLTPTEVEQIISKVLAANEEYIEKNGEHAFGKLMGDVMEILRGKVDGQIVNEKLRKLLKEKLNS